ncbi:protein broad-minded isoform X2 [Nilaparvata lugens]|uniref:protein broad-minded isoform X2 n=1 Tax=Nilaparvata lugens TaxID=108931 RepID=UPI00193DF68F|nr:protein broad-minded isoform X2 [Nilaparvata lugens]
MHLVDNLKILWTLMNSLQNFIVKVGTTPLGFSLLMRASPTSLAGCLLHRLEQPDTPWLQPDWRIFVTFAAATRNGGQVIGQRAAALAKSQLLDLWAALELETDSTIDIDECRQHLLTVMATCGSSLQGVTAIVNIANDGDNTDDDNASDDTITEQLFEYRPASALELLSKKSLLEVSSCDYRVQETVLTVLNIFTSQLNCALYLQAKLQIQELLLAQQKLNRVDESSDTVIVDECSLLRHEILERSHVAGRPGVDGKLYFAFPSLSTASAERRQRPRTAKHGGGGELSRFLQETRSGLHDTAWLKQARKAYRAGCAAGDEIKCGLFVDLVSLVPKAVVGDRPTIDSLKWPTIDQVETVNLLPEEEIGVQMAVRYGLHHRALQPSQHNAENLMLMLRMVKLMFGRDEQETFTGFDWFLSTIFLISGGNVERCQNILSVLVTLSCIIFIWPSYAQFQGHSTDAFGHLLESMVAHEVPFAFNALRMAGISWWQLCDGWLSECLWRLLSWRDLCSWLTFLLLHSSADYPLYLLAAIPLHSHSHLLHCSLSSIVTNPPDRLNMNDLLPHIDKLWKRYHSGLLPLLISSSSSSAH